MKTAFATLLFSTVPGIAGAVEVGAHASDYGGGAWSPYLVGAGIGVLSWCTFLFADKPIGASSFYASIAGFIGKVVAPRYTASLKYFKENPPAIGWGFAFVLSIIGGGFIAAWSGGEIRNEFLHPMWVDRFGDTPTLRAATALLGGAFTAFGARLAGGCTSGHGISGTLQLNPGSWLVAACIFIGGIATAFALYSTL